MSEVTFDELSPGINPELVAAIGLFLEKAAKYGPGRLRYWKRRGKRALLRRQRRARLSPFVRRWSR